MRIRAGLSVLLALDLLTVFWLCLTPRSVTICEQGMWWQPWTWCLPELPTWLGNVLLLVPTALLLHWLRRNTAWWQIALVCAVMSAVIELAQFAIPGRVPDLRDWILNCAGALLAAWLVHGRKVSRSG